MTESAEPNPSFLARATREGLFERPTDFQLAYLPTWAVVCPLPIRDPGSGTVGSPAVWQATSGRSPSSLTVRWGCRWVGEGERARPVGFPYGRNGRLALAILCRLIRSRVPDAHGGLRLRLGRSESLALAGKPTSGGSGSGRQVLRDQLERLLLSLVFLDRPTGEGLRHEVQIPSVATELASGGGDVLDVEIVLNPAFVESLESAMPTDLRVMRAFGRNCLAMDLWHWANYRCGVDEPRHIDWESLRAQFGQTSTGQRRASMWRLQVRRALADIRALQPGLGMEEGRGGLVIHPSESWIPRP